MEYLPDKDKSARLHACTPYLQSERVWVPPVTERREWVSDFLSEVVTFPYAAHDDFVDVFSMAVLWMRDNYQLHHEGLTDFNEDEDEMALNNKRRTYWAVTAEKLAR
jgi:hypothetical protein